MAQAALRGEGLALARRHDPIKPDVDGHAESHRSSRSERRVRLLG